MAPAIFGKSAAHTAEIIFSQPHLVSRNVTVNGHRTSVRLETDMWQGLKDICKRERLSTHDICSAVAVHKRADSSLTAALRVFVMAYFRAAATDDGHRIAGHGVGGPYGIVAQILRPQNAERADLENGLQKLG